MRFNKGLLGGSLILLVTFNSFSFLNFAYNILMARMLPLAAYGSLTALMSIIIIFTIFSESIQTILSKYVSKERSIGKVKNIMKKSFKKSFKISILIFILFIIISIALSHYLKIKYSILALTGLIIFSYFLISITRGILQGKKKFFPLGINMVLEGVFKLSISVVLVLIGWGLYGAITGVILGTIAALILSFIPLRDVIRAEEKSSKTPNIQNYSKPVLITTLSILLFLTLDVILAKVFFTPEVAGAYAISSTIAKIIFIGTQPVSKAMFPYSAEAKRNSESRGAFQNSLLTILALVSVALVILFLFPNLIVLLYSGKIISSSASILFFLGIAMSFLSLTNLVLYYNLSIGKTKSYMVLFAFIIFEIILLSMFHNNLLEYSIALITASATFLWGSVLLLNR